MNDERKEWLKSLRVGDKVCYKYGLYGKDFTFTTVKNITKGGRIRLNCDTLLDLDGKVRRSYGFSIKIYPITQEVLDSIKKSKMVNKLYRFDFNSLSLEQLEQIYSIIGGDLLV